MTDTDSIAGMLLMTHIPYWLAAIYLGTRVRALRLGVSRLADAAERAAAGPAASERAADERAAGGRR